MCSVQVVRASRQDLCTVIGRGGGVDGYFRSTFLPFVTSFTVLHEKYENILTLYSAHNSTVGIQRSNRKSALNRSMVWLKNYLPITGILAPIFPPITPLDNPVTMKRAAVGVYTGIESVCLEEASATSPWVGSDHISVHPASWGSRVQFSHCPWGGFTSRYI